MREGKITKSETTYINESRAPKKQEWIRKDFVSSGGIPKHEWNIIKSLPYYFDSAFTDSYSYQDKKRQYGPLNQQSLRVALPMIPSAGHPTWQFLTFRKITTRERPWKEKRGEEKPGQIGLMATKIPELPFRDPTLSLIKSAYWNHQGSVKG